MSGSKVCNHLIYLVCKACGVLCQLSNFICHNKRKPLPPRLHEPASMAAFSASRFGLACNLAYHFSRLSYKFYAVFCLSLPQMQSDCSDPQSLKQRSSAHSSLLRRFLWYRQFRFTDWVSSTIRRWFSFSMSLIFLALFAPPLNLMGLVGCALCNTVYGGRHRSLTLTDLSNARFF